MQIPLTFLKTQVWSNGIGEGNLLWFLQIYLSFYDYKERSKSMTQREIKTVQCSQCFKMVFYKRCINIWVGKLCKQAQVRTWEDTAAQRNKGPFFQSPFTYLNINSPSLQLKYCSLFMALWHYCGFHLNSALC